jgi:hypothetical protein
MAGGILPAPALSASGAVVCNAPSQDGSNIAITPYALAGWSATGSGSAIIYDGTSSAGVPLANDVAAGEFEYPEELEINSGHLYVAITGTLSVIIYFMH